ncbi:sialate O-acetylesterase [Clostridium sp. SHJSY1]|uniref:sialate O-acetylesterase n=1 Tax=Clostridium sp. SHJSY1 TaxID=2942483 RepID=UPI0028742B55|nr:sialate O-acetylesterase [Clostridium sp. SHJSY1]MDS0526297.1 sialate O-acetylesterase [Clostridium sp. SHJSY1]
MDSKYHIENKKNQNRTIDLAIFMGQSNMAGRGDSFEAPMVSKGHGYEFRAISDPTKLYDIVEPFGVNENNDYGISEPEMKTGSLISSFVISYYKVTDIPLVCISASKGGSSISKWKPNGNYLNDSVNRLKEAKKYLINNGYIIRRKFMVWCQGETDGDHNMSELEYKEKFKAIVEEMIGNGIEKCFLICIGNHRDLPKQYMSIIKAQIDFCKESENVVLVSTQFKKMAELGLMKDSFHYKQIAYNMVGTEAGNNVGLYNK